MLINCALGFDSYLVMRHGDSATAPATTATATTTAAAAATTAAAAAATAVTGPARLGCYFCNDVVAAVNSQKDRTLDQQVSNCLSYYLIIYLFLFFCFYYVFI